jgi:hypothetical protein
MAAALLSSTAISSAALGQTDESLLLKPWKDDQRIEASMSFLWSPHGAPGSSGALTEESGSGRFRLSVEHELNPTLGLDFYRLETNDVTGRTPGVLTDQSIALASPVGRLGDWFVAARAGIGYAGEGAYEDGNAWYAKGSLTVGRDLPGGAGLVLWLDYDGNRALFPDVPLPHVEYSKDFGDDLSILIGLPDCSIEWHPTRNVAVSASWTAPLTFEASANLNLGNGVSIFASYRDDTKAFHAPSLRDNQRLFYDFHRVETGVRYEPVPSASFSATVGYGFQQSFKTGFDERDLSHLSSIPDGPFLSVGIRISF